ncbi:hypothetical protein QLQ15_13950 [Lysobacter sp. LF1]|uniref:Uncharacterized protein n=1 Tax=Lysobacter stagni TaxID=3045172 RepID=A0ABT6XIM5_9GAMM|nr:hypothetical protein [Lysobacter sp. LF1]MDI9240012.1 hypothetical protein [Lysobacter sp. LF1]
MEGFVNDAVRFYTDLIGRAEGPMTFRFVLQPTMALLMAVRDGFKDAKVGRAPYFWTITHDPVHRSASLNEGVKATGRILVLGLVMEIIYQYRVFGTFHVLEAVNFIVLLCFIPYLIMRGPINRLAHWWMARRHRSA